MQTKFVRLPWIMALCAPFALGLTLSMPAQPRGQASVQGTPGSMPELPKVGPEFWVNSAPLQSSDFKGQVVLIEVWTFT